MRDLFTEMEYVVREVATFPCNYVGKCNSTRCMSCAAKNIVKRLDAPKTDIKAQKKLKGFRKIAQTYRNWHND